MSVIGFDDVLLARYLRPKLTTLRYPIEAMVQQAAQLAVSLSLKEPCDSLSNKYQPSLVERYSVTQR